MILRATFDADLHVATTAATLAASGDADALVVIPTVGREWLGEQGDDDLRAVAAIDVLRTLVADYETTQEDQ